MPLRPVESLRSLSGTEELDVVVVVVVVVAAVVVAVAGVVATGGVLVVTEAGTEGTGCTSTFTLLGIGTRPGSDSQECLKKILDVHKVQER